MKVYAIKTKKTKKLIHTMDIEGIFSVKLFTNKEKAENFCPNYCEVVECYFMDETEFADYTKQARREVRKDK